MTGSAPPVLARPGSTGTTKRASLADIAGRGLLGVTEAAASGLLDDQIFGGADPLGQMFLDASPVTDRRPLGQFYTPAALVDSMLDWCASTRAGDPQRIVDSGARLTDTDVLRSVIDLPLDLDVLTGNGRDLVEQFLDRARSIGVHQGYVATHRRLQS